MEILPIIDSLSIVKNYSEKLKEDYSKFSNELKANITDINLREQKQKGINVSELHLTTNSLLGHTVIIDGKVSWLGKGPHGDLILKLDDNVECSFPKSSQKEIFALELNSKVTIKGTVYKSGKTIILRHSIFFKKKDLFTLIRPL